MDRPVKIRGSLLKLVVAGASLLVAAGCYEERPYPPPPYGMAYYDYYYPDEEVYFYPETGVYFWFGGGEWHRGRHLPRTVVLHNESRVNVRINSRAPYEHHEEIRARYPAHAPAVRPAPVSESAPPPAPIEPGREGLPGHTGR